MGAANQAINNLQNMFKSHMDDLGALDNTRNRLSQLEEQCREKDEEIRRLENMVATLTKMDLKTKAKIKHEFAEIQKGKQELEKEKAKQERRVAMATLEERHKLENEFGKLTTQHTVSYETRMKELEDKFAQKEVENARKITALEVEKKQLSTAVEELKKTIEVKSEELDKTTEQCDVLERAKDSIKRDKQAQDRELEVMKHEFALNHKSKDYLYVF